MFKWLKKLWKKIRKIVATILIIIAIVIGLFLGYGYFILGYAFTTMTIFGVAASVWAALAAGAVLFAMIIDRKTATRVLNRTMSSLGKTVGTVGKAVGKGAISFATTLLGNTPMLLLGGLGAYLLLTDRNDKEEKHYVRGSGHEEPNHLRV